MNRLGKYNVRRHTVSSTQRHRFREFGDGTVVALRLAGDGEYGRARHAKLWLTGYVTVYVQKSRSRCATAYVTSLNIIVNRQRKRESMYSENTPLRRARQYVAQE